MDGGPIYFSCWPAGSSQRQRCPPLYHKASKASKGRTLDQLPMGSRLTPRLISAPASSRRRVLSVLVRRVTGRGTCGGGPGHASQCVRVIAYKLAYELVNEFVHKRVGALSHADPLYTYHRRWGGLCRAG